MNQVINDDVNDLLTSQLAKLVGANKPRMLFDDAVQKFVSESNNKDEVGELHLFKVISPYFKGMYLDQITRQDINRLIEGRKADGVSNTTINRALQKIRALLRRAAIEWDVLCDVPHIKLLKEPRLRVRWLTKIEASRLVSVLPDHLAAMMQFTLETGLRESNVTLLEWRQIDLHNRVIFIEGDDVLKGEKSFAVPLSEKAMSILIKERGKHTTRVFTYKDKPVRRANGRAFRKALQQVNIEDFRWHDLRHTWATWHVQKGTPLHVLQELGGWQNINMVKRYAHYDHKFLHQWV
ncbi:integrase [Thiomicrospira aerophila AL3]|uniref:Integrase n=2 Tax=Thiomicrospira aerophila TaxID=92245 RepID=W0DX15_9GAMM|nr:integrase [Thiomicrospira aerophila AL3]